MNEYSHSSEFERVYFHDLLNPPKTIAKKSAEPTVSLDNIPGNLIKVLNQIEFETKPAFSDTTCELELSLDKGAILKSSCPKILGKTVIELVSKSSTITEFMQKESIPPFITFLQEIIKKNAPVPQTSILISPQKKAWVVTFTPKTNGDKTVFEASDITKLVARSMGKGFEEEVKEELPEIRSLDLIIFRYTNVPGDDAKKWTTRTAALLKKANLWPLDFRTRFVAVRYEDDPKEKADFNHPFIDDLLCLPLDRLILLQKIEFVLGLPKKITPSYLYVQEVDDSVEISKKVLIERISDLGLAIANPIPLAQGTPGHFYFRFPGQKPLLEIFGKVTQSIPHPERSGQHLTFFSFFGLDKSTNKEIKAFLARDTGYKSLVDADPENFKFNPDNIFITDEEKRRKGVVILDVDEGVVKSTTDYLRNEIGNLEVVFDDTYYSFFKRYLSKKTAENSAPPAAPNDLYAESVSILVNPSDLKLQMVLTPPKETSEFFGYKAAELFSNSQSWIDLFPDDSKNLLDECFNLVKNVKRLSKIFDIQNIEGIDLLVNLDIIYEDSSGFIRITFRVPESKILARSSKVSHLESLDCVIIDYDLLPSSVSSLSESLILGLDKSGIKYPPGGPKIIVLANEGREINMQKLLDAKVFGLVFKPAEIRRLIYLVSSAIHNPFTVYNFENIGWKIDHIGAKIARATQLKELSEFGAAISSDQPLKPGTMLYLFKSIFENAPDQNLCARVFHSQEDPKNPGRYLNSVIYFGITDAFLKYTRAFIKGTYAAKKSKEGS